MATNYDHQLNHLLMRFQSVNNHEAGCQENSFDPPDEVLSIILTD